jgi:hypothetical protein
MLPHAGRSQKHLHADIKLFNQQKKRGGSNPLEIDADSATTQPHLGCRTRSARSQDAPAVKTPNGEVLHVLKGGYDSLGCAGSDTDCTSSTQLEIAVEGGALVVRNVGRFPHIQPGAADRHDLAGPVAVGRAGFPRRVYTRGKKARINIKTGGL